MVGIGLMLMWLMSMSVGASAMRRDVERDVERPGEGWRSGSYAYVVCKRGCGHWIVGDEVEGADWLVRRLQQEGCR